MLVFDSSSIILLAKLELLDLLLKNYIGGVVIPDSVEKEVMAKATFDALLIKKRIEEGKISVKSAKDHRVERIMADFKMGLGETEAVVLAMGGKKSILATDDKNAINACKLLGIPFTTAIGVIIRSVEKGLLPKEAARKKLNMLKQYGWYKKEIIEEALKALG